MVGITSMGAYIPMYRLQREEIARMWGQKRVAGEKAIAGYDEDSVTMAIAAAQECINRGSKNVDSIYFASTTAPYQEKQSAAILASVIGLDRRCATADFANSLRSCTTAIKSAIDAVSARSVEQVLVTASDCRIGAPKGRIEQLVGDGAAALAIGSENVLAEIESYHCIFSEFTDQWRTAKNRFIQSGEGRFIEEEGYLPTMLEIVSSLMQAHSLKPGDFSKIVLAASDSRQHTKLSKMLGFESTQVQDPYFIQIGHIGTASTMIMLIAALEKARSGDRILMANYGDGADAFIFRVTDAINTTSNKPHMQERLKRNRSIDYGTYLNWRALMPLAPDSLPPKSEPSLSTRWRERKIISTLSGVKCRNCGFPQVHPIGQNIRICIQCQAKDDFEEYRFSDKQAKLFTYAIDHLQPTKNPPGVNGVIDFEGGGRLICELTDYDLSKVAIGMSVEMTFRKMSDSAGIVNYFWKAKPVAA